MNGNVKMNKKPTKVAPKKTTEEDEDKKKKRIIFFILLGFVVFILIVTLLFILLSPKGEDDPEVAGNDRGDYADVLGENMTSACGGVIYQKHSDFEYHCEEGTYMVAESKANTINVAMALVSYPLDYIAGHMGELTSSIVRGGYTVGAQQTRVLDDWQGLMFQIAKDGDTQYFSATRAGDKQSFTVQVSAASNAASLDDMENGLSLLDGVIIAGAPDRAVGETVVRDIEVEDD